MIAIKGMKMPSRCEVCDFRKSDHYNGEEYCSKAIGSNIIIHEKERLENCPLIEIVTCKDCKNCWCIEGSKNKLCEKHGCMKVSNNFYCADGERKE